MAVILETSLGNMTVDLFTDERPKCTCNHNFTVGFYIFLQTKGKAGTSLPYFNKCLKIV